MPFPARSQYAKTGRDGCFFKYPKIPEKQKQKTRHTKKQGSMAQSKEQNKLQTPTLKKCRSMSCLRKKLTVIKMFNVAKKQNKKQTTK